MAVVTGIFQVQNWDYRKGGLWVSWRLSGKVVDCLYILRSWRLIFSIRLYLVVYVTIGWNWNGNITHFFFSQVLEIGFLFITLTNYGLNGMKEIQRVFHLKGGILSVVSPPYFLLILPNGDMFWIYIRLKIYIRYWLKLA